MVVTNSYALLLLPIVSLLHYTHFFLFFLYLFHFSFFFLVNNKGEPAPRVTWFKEHALIDDSFTELNNGSVINVLHLPRITRVDLETVSVLLLWIIKSVCHIHMMTMMKNVECCMLLLLQRDDERTNTQIPLGVFILIGRVSLFVSFSMTCCHV